MYHLPKLINGLKMFNVGVRKIGNKLRILLCKNMH